MRAEHGTHPLEGLRAVELSGRTACRLSGTLLAQLGAEVVALEDHAALRLPAAQRAALVAGKRCINAADTAPALLQRLVDAADVVIVSDDERGAALADVSAVDGTGGILVRLAGMDGTPLDSGDLGIDLAVQALSGMLDTTGLPDRAPCAVDGEPLEVIAALHAATGVLAALRARARDGNAGQQVRVSLMDCALSSHAVFVSNLAADPDANSTRSGNRHLLAAPWNVFRAADGWLLICMASDRQWVRACELMQRPELAHDPDFERGAARTRNRDAVEGAVQDWVADLDVETVSRLLLEAGIPCGAVAPVDGFPREANLDHRQMVVNTTLPGGEPVHLAASPLHAGRSAAVMPAGVPAPDADRFWAAQAWPTPRPQPANAAASARPAPLAGIRVLELGHYTTAPLAARYLANLGAEVIKIEPPGGEPMRPWMPQRHGLGAFFIVNNAGKRSVELDLKSDAGRAALETLVATADVLVENLKPGALARMGFDAARLEALNPGLVYCAVSGFGADSVYPGRPAYDTVIQAMSGVMDRIRSDGEPMKTGMSGADAMGANFAVLAIIAALAHRDATGEGQFIDVSMQDVTAWSLQLAWNDAPCVQDRVRVLAAADGYVVVDAALAVDAGIVSTLTRDACRSRWPGHVMPVNSVSEALQSRSSGTPVLEVADEQGASWPVLANPIRLSRTPLVHPPIVAALGEDNERLLGTSAAEA